MNDDILKLAKECFCVIDGEWISFLEVDLEAFYRAAFNAGLEAAATKSARMANGNSIAVAIRALKEKP